MAFFTDWWGRKVARLPDRGVLLVATDLQGNLDDYRALRAIYEREDAAGNAPILLFCGDLVHGPTEAMSRPEDWPRHLGSFYLDRSAELVFEVMADAKTHRVMSLLGNHEHAHVGGPVVSKFHDDEAAALEARLGDRVGEVRAFFAGLPLVAVAPCGIVCSHGAPRATEASLEAFEALDYGGFEGVPLWKMIDRGTVGGLLWARGASEHQARALLAVTGGSFVAYGHDIVREGFERIGREQICVSTSFGCFDRDKAYLRIELGARYAGVEDLHEGTEIRRLYP